MISNLDRLTREISREIELELERIGLLFRIFSRTKSDESIRRKLIFKAYESDSNDKLMQDIIGVRINLYFNDDLNIIRKALKARPNFIDETVDTTTETVFKPERINLVFRLDETQSIEVNEKAVSEYKYVDNTFEIQLRTVLSEGWHEVDHDLRYKCEDDWVDSSDIARTFNGIYASLVTSDWSILTIFEELAYRQYKVKNWTAMLRHKFRLRLRDEVLNKNLIEILDGNEQIAKQIFRTDRSDFINKLFNEDIRVPLTLSNLVFLSNIYYIGDKSILKLMPESLLKNKKLQNYLAK